MTVFETTLTAIENFEKTFSVLPNEPKQLAWNLTMALSTSAFKHLHANTFYAVYEISLDSLSCLLEYIKGLHTELMDPFESEAQYEYMEHAAKQIQVHMPTLTKAFVPHKLKQAGEILVKQCVALCNHFSAFQEAAAREYS